MLALPTEAFLVRQRQIPHHRQQSLKTCTTTTTTSTTTTTTFTTAATRTKSVEQRFVTQLGTATEEGTTDTDTIATATSVQAEDGTPVNPTKGCIVRIACRLQPEGDFVPEPLIDGIVLHDDEPTVDLTFVLGWGNYLPGLHDIVSEMTTIGESRVNVSLDAGWGDVNPNLIATIAFADAGIADPSQIKVGTQLVLAQQNVPCVVTEVTDTTFTIDANPPLAGASYVANVTLKAVEPGPVIGKYSDDPSETSSTSRYEVATFALGCFWGGELGVCGCV
jgi:FKBP-type peptidyl-prolyl cis-trans isomerase 2